jgi:hypothetical protein
VDLGGTWRLHFGDLPAVAHLMRRHLQGRWLRIHSLPDSKRYAEDESEFAELARRHNLVATEILGSSDVLLVAHARGDIDDFRSAYATFDWAQRSGLANAEPTMVQNVDDPAERLVLGYSRIPWTPGSWDDLLRDVANYVVPSVVIYNSLSGEVYAPYDGGADVFVRNADRVTELRTRWQDWMSTRPDGL